MPVYIDSLEVLHVLYALVYIDSLHALQVFNVLVYIDSLHARELFVYINLPLLRHFIYSRRLFKSTLYHIFMQFGRRSIAIPIDSAQSMYSFFTLVYYLYTRVVLCTQSQLCSHLKICFTPISLSSSFLQQLDLYVYPRLPRAAAPPIDVYMQTLCCVPPGCESDLVM